MCVNALEAHPFLDRATEAIEAAGWDTSLAAPTATARSGVAFYPIRTRGRAAARRLRHLAAHTDAVLVDARSLPLVQRARVRAPVVLLADEELLGRRAQALRDARVDLAVATSHSAAAPLRWRGIETVVIKPPVGRPVDIPRREPADIVGCVARFDAGAGLDVLLDAFAALARPELTLEIVAIDGTDRGASADGNGAARLADTLRARAARPDLDGRVRFVDAPIDRRVLMQHWRVAVTPNVALDAPSAPLRDAVALGVPVVATNRGANAEFVGTRGVLVRPGRPRELADAIAQVLDVGRRPFPPAAAQLRGATAAGAHDELVEVLSAVAERGVRRRAGTIVFVVPDYEPTLGGTTRQARNQARELRARGYDVEILTQRLELHWPRSELHNGLRVRRVTPSGRTFLRMKLLVLSVSRWLRRHRDDIAVVNVIMYPDFVVSAVLAGLGSRTVMCWAGLGDATDTIGTKGPLRAPLRAVRRRALSRAAQVALTPALHDELDRLGLGRDVSVIPTPVDLDEFRPPDAAQRFTARRALGVADDELVIAYTGHLRALKRVERLVEAFDQLVASGRSARLLLVGSSRDDFVDRPTSFLEVLGRSEARDRIIITGAVSDVRPYLHAADAFVLPSDREGLSNSVLEALASGLPVVAPPSAAGDQVLDETCGIVPESNAPEHLFAALTRLADDPSYRASLAKGARQAAERFGLAHVVNEYESLYTRLRRRGAVR